MNNSWLDEETRLFNNVMYPRRRKVTMHSLNPANHEKRKQILQLIEKQKIREFEEGWKNLRLLLEH